MKVIDVIQGSDEWRKIRCGRLTASRISDALAKTKSGWGASRANLMADLICERLTGLPVESYTNAAMAWGSATEPAARDAYQFYADTEVVQVGFVEHPTIGMSGASPDGHVSDHGAVEIKCPQSATHIETLLGQSVPQKYIMQIQWQLSCSGRAWCDFVSFDPRLPPSMQLFVRRIVRDGAMIAELEKEARIFLAELDAKLAQLTSLYEKAA